MYAPFVYHCMLSSLDLFLDMGLCNSTRPFYWFVRGLRSEELFTEQRFLLVIDSIWGTSFHGCKQLWKSTELWWPELEEMRRLSATGLPSLQRVPLNIP